MYSKVIQIHIKFYLVNQFILYFPPKNAEKLLTMKNKTIINKKCLAVIVLTMLSATLQAGESKMNLKIINKHTHIFSYCCFKFFEALRCFSQCYPFRISPVRTPDRKGGSLRKCMFSWVFQFCNFNDPATQTSDLWLLFPDQSFTGGVLLSESLIEKNA